MTAPMKIAFTGRPKLGGVQMRGIQTAEAMGVPFVPINEIRASDRWDVLVVVKYWAGYEQTLRAAAARLIFDPLDLFESSKPSAAPHEFWQWQQRHLRFSDILATSPACFATMEAAVSADQIHLTPHHADPRIKNNITLSGCGWYDPRGPVVYCGGLRYIESALPDLQRACGALNRLLVVNTDRDAWKGLRGAALSLHLRMPPFDTPLNRHCKPQVKLENAAAAGVPILCSPDPCVLSLRPDVPTWDGGRETLRDTLAAAIESPPLPQASAVSIEQHAAKMWEIIRDGR